MEKKLKAVQKKELAKESWPNKGDNKKGAAPVDVNNNSIKGKPINVKNNGAIKRQPKTGKVEPQAVTSSPKDNKKNSKANQEKVESGPKKIAGAQSTKKGKKEKNSDVPTVEEMILEAIKSLGEKQGSSSKPIKDHIVEIYKDSVDEKKLPTTYQVNKVLAKAVEDNLVVQNKQRFQLSAKEASKEDANAKNKRMLPSRPILPIKMHMKFHSSV